MSFPDGLKNQMRKSVHFQLMSADSTFRMNLHLFCSQVKGQLMKVGGFLILSTSNYVHFYLA